MKTTTVSLKTLENQEAKLKQELELIAKKKEELAKKFFKLTSVLELRDFNDVVSAAKERNLIKKWTTQRSTEEDHEYAYRQLVLIVKVLNEGWTPNWNDNCEKKHYCWFSVSSGFAFANTHYGYDYASMATGSRLCFKSRELAEFAGKTFTDIYKVYFM